MLAQEIIRKKRAGLALEKEEISFMLEGMLSGQVTESQMAAFAMAVYFQNMTIEECQNLTSCLQNSGTTLDWSAYNLPGPVVDKHSTGGIGDKVSLILAPMLAACGVYVPMISGRGLGHSGGTLDKMESIPGYNCEPKNGLFQQVVSDVGCAIVGQTANLAPADKMLYGIRDVTATVESLPLITASILSKKLAAGLDALVMDVKVGTGAFNDTMEVAEELAGNLVKVANANGLPTAAVITDMNQNLGYTAGNALEVQEAIDYLTNTHREPRLHSVVMRLCIEALSLSKFTASQETAENMLMEALMSGAALKKFDDMVLALGGPEAFSEKAEQLLPKAPIQSPFFPEIERTSAVQAIDGRAIGNAIIALGGGRTRPQDSIDHAVGFSDIKGIGATVAVDEPLLIIHARTEEDVTEAKLRLQSAFEFATASVASPPAVLTAIHLQDEGLVTEQNHEYTQ